MNSTFLDFSTIGANELDPTPLLKVLPDLRIYDTTSPSQVVERIRDAEVVLLNKVKFDRAVLQQAPKLRCIGLTATGVDNIDLDAARELGIAVCNVTAYCTQSVVEHVFGTLLTLTHNLNQYNAAVRAGAWQKSAQFCMLDYPLRELSAMTMGIVGSGNLGGAVARTAEFFGMQVLFAQRAGASESDDGRLPLDELLRTVDVLSLHCPLNEQTAGLIGTRELALMKNSALLINTARGGLVDSAALVNAIDSGQIAGAAIDVLGEEPPVNGDPLLESENPRLYVTPHIGWATREARQNSLEQLANNVDAFLRGERRNRVD
ncbi:MAG: D-2-hydroxyacid dehydrogenase [Woeseia sp.]